MQSIYHLPFTTRARWILALSSFSTFRNSADLLYLDLTNWSNPRSFCTTICWLKSKLLLFLYTGNCYYSKLPTSRGYCNTLSTPTSSAYEHVYKYTQSKILFIRSHRSCILKDHCSVWHHIGIFLAAKTCFTAVQVGCVYHGNTVSTFLEEVAYSAGLLRLFDIRVMQHLRKYTFYQTPTHTTFGHCGQDIYMYMSHNILCAMSDCVCLCVCMCARARVCVCVCVCVCACVLVFVHVGEYVW